MLFSDFKFENIREFKYTLSYKCKNSRVNSLFQRVHGINLDGHFWAKICSAVEICIQQTHCAHFWSSADRSQCSCTSIASVSVSCCQLVVTKDNVANGEKVLNNLFVHLFILQIRILYLLRANSLAVPKLQWAIRCFAFKMFFFSFLWLWCELVKQCCQHHKIMWWKQNQ